MDAPTSPADLDPLQGPLPAYRAMVARGDLVPDPAQRLAAERLQSLWGKLRGYDPASTPESGHGLLTRLFGRRATEGADEVRPHGLYIVGEVGRGKSMLMDLFFATASLTKKRRIHFHAFMQEVHHDLHAWRAADRSGAIDPIAALADSVAAGAALLCFDEFQITNIADAMILGRLFQALFARGVVVVATSNTPPDALFAGQPGRDAFLPFIGLIKQHLDVLALEGGRDFRRARLRGLPTWHVPADARAERALDAAFLELTGGAAAHAERLVVLGRPLVVPLAANGVARFDFAALCATAMGPPDYLALATHYHGLVIDDVPRLSPQNHDAARRFVTLVDALYEHRVKLVTSAAAAPDELYERGEGADAFRRTASRLEEMQGAAWLELPHLT